MLKYLLPLFLCLNLCADWHKASEEKPVTGHYKQQYLYYNTSQRIVIGYHIAYDPDSEYVMYYDGDWGYATHWMEMPEVPHE